MLLIHIQKEHTASSPRLQYVLDILLKKVLGVNYRIFQKKPTSSKLPPFPIITYGPKPLPFAQLHIPEEGLLKERHLRQHPPKTGMWQNTPTLFPINVQNKKSLPFDLFAAAFFLLSRYEEYLPFKPDPHGRFPAQAALLYPLGYPEKPFVHLWAKQLWEKLKTSTSRLPTQTLPAFEFIPTYDLDLPWSVAHKRPLQMLGGLLRNFKNYGFKSIKLHYTIWRKPVQDPFYTFPQLQKWHRYYKLTPLYFAPVGPYTRYDKSPSHKNPAYRRLLRRLAAEGPIGLHPSYYSTQNPKQLLREKRRLENILQQKVTQSRQHFLRFRFPHTPRLLLNTGIYHDYTLGFAEKPGFRAGICLPFPWYDLLKEKQTKLILHPLSIMDISLTQYMKLNTDQAIEICKTIVSQTKQSGGKLYTLFHNNTLAQGEVKTIYNRVMELASY